MLEIQGRVSSLKDNTPLQGASIGVKETDRTVTTDADGRFHIRAGVGSYLEVSYVGFQKKIIKLISGVRDINIQLEEVNSDLDEVVVMGYGTTSKRLNTGNISKVSSKEIENQPVSNPLAALIGRVPGLVITQRSGIAGSGFSVQIRGQNSLLQGSEPFFIVDGVPFSPGNTSLNQVNNATDAAGISPFNLLNIGDIESIEILKDADATAIYGSRGANGVIMITTKKGKQGKTQFNAKVIYGVSKATKIVQMLNTQQYVEMRKEGFANDGIVPDASNAPDLLVFDTTRYTDFAKMFSGGTANALDVQTSISGGNVNTQFYVGGGYHRETTVLPVDLPNSKASAYFKLNHRSINQKFQLNLSANFVSATSNLTNNDLTFFSSTMPHLKIYDDEGNLNWEEGGVTYRAIGLTDANPMAYLKKRYKGQFQNLNSNLNIGYSILKGLDIKINLGYNLVYSDELSTTPSTSLDPNSTNQPYSYFGNSKQSSWIIEPQLDYSRRIGPHKISILLGSTLQDRKFTGIYTQATGYSSDILLESIASAADARSSNSFGQYRYSAAFARLGYSYQDRYIANISGRRDGSSRFGPGKQFSNFGAIGLGWIFSSTSLIKEFLPWLSFGKLRGSYGTTGNDQIGDYKFLDTWTAGQYTFQGMGTLGPTSLFNPDYAWELTRKLEFGLEMGFLQNRVILTASYFRNRSGNQLINYTLPIQTGFSQIGKNLDAEIQNKGFEFVLTSKNIVHKNLQWSSNFNLSLIRNKLLNFPGLASSSYANRYTIGQPINSIKTYHYLGVDPASGLYTFEDLNSDGNLDVQDYASIVKTEPVFYGGLSNSISFKQFQFDLFLEFRKQTGRNYLGSSNSGLGVPGYGYVNKPILILDRWRSPGDVSEIQRYTASTSTAYLNGISYLPGSDGIYTDASFIRCRSVMISYVFKSVKPSIPSIRVYATAQNLFTVSGYKGADPENQNMMVLSPLRTIAGGIEINF
ncbi:MAG: hypothetical protein BGO52_08465 [Sphingobacteriales bacterium 44-61]|nr:MAG: hypothetical protein BGO52_08465 [Sphingobacteriales bacterium 44-61]